MSENAGNVIQADFLFGQGGVAHVEYCSSCDEITLQVVPL